MNYTNPKKNAEGYSDLTAHYALRSAAREERKRRKSHRSKPAPPKIYICSPFRGDIERNTDNAIRYCRFALKRGYFPIAPHCYLPRFMEDDNPVERELALSFGLRLLQGCHELWVFGDVISEGMKREIDAAKRHNIKIKSFTVDCKEGNV